MNAVGKKMGMAELITSHTRIQIPMIQRDYAQGRQSASEIRTLFLDALEGALNPNGDSSKPLNLDFIYGSVEDKQRDYFAPLDGQQRLTTLFLLHWHLAWVDSEWDTFSSLFKDGDDCRFSYEVRPSSEEFFDNLVRYKPDRQPQEIRDLKAVITNQSWFLRYYDRDPTIQSALSMLDAIHARFKTSTGLFRRLTDSNVPAITFQALDLKDFGLSDDLYIKMNARGKPLTPFETFKAQYEQELPKLFPKVRRNIGGEEFSIADFVARRMDTAWTDFFWVHRNEDTQLPDEPMMNIFRMVALVSRNPESNTYLKDINLLRGGISPPSYSTFHAQGWLDEAFTNVLISLLEAWSASDGFSKPLLPNTCYFNEKEIFEQLIDDPSRLSAADVVLFSGYALFIQQHEAAIDRDLFQEWMRVVHNLAINSDIDRNERLLNPAKGLRELLPKSAVILKHFSELAAEDRVTGFGDQQVKEEKLKAGLILNHVGWRPLIERAEKHGYFRGQIEFLCEFSGAAKQWKDTGIFAWDDATHLVLQKRFEGYLKMAEGMFNAQGLVSVEKNRWRRALLTFGDFMLPSGLNWSFLVNAVTDPSSWKRLLRGSGPNVSEKRLLLKQLWDRLTTDRPFEEQLDAIIAAATGLEPWIEAFVRTPAALDYCQRQSIRWNPDTEIYLLSTTQMNGFHAELFSYSLYHELLSLLNENGGLKPLALAGYGYAKGTEEEPCFRLCVDHGECNLWFRVEFKNRRFHTRILWSEVKSFPELRALLCDSGGFTDDGHFLSKNSAAGAIKESLIELAQLLSTLLEKTDD